MAGRNKEGVTNPAIVFLKVPTSILSTKMSRNYTVTHELRSGE